MEFQWSAVSQMISLGPENSTTPFTIKTYYKIYNFNLYIEYPHDAVTFRYLRPFPVFALLRPRIYSRPAPKRIHSFDTTYVQYFTRIFRENPFFVCFEYKKHELFYYWSPQRAITTATKRINYKADGQNVRDKFKWVFITLKQWQIRVIYVSINIYFFSTT